MIFILYEGLDFGDSIPMSACFFVCMWRYQQWPLMHRSINYWGAANSQILILAFLFNLLNKYFYKDILFVCPVAYSVWKGMKMFESVLTCIYFEDNSLSIIHINQLVNKCLPSLVSKSLSCWLLNHFDMTVMVLEGFLPF